jgi:hypothetical protein
LRVRSPVLQFQGRYRGYENRKGRGRGGDDITSSRFNSNVYRIYISFLSDFQSPWSRFPPTDKEGTASIHGDLPSAVSHANSVRQVAVGAAAPQLCSFLAANLGRAGAPKSPGARNSFSLAVQPALGLCSSQVGYDVRLRVGTTLCHLMTRHLHMIQFAPRD